MCERTTPQGRQYYEDVRFMGNSSVHSRIEQNVLHNSLFDDCCSVLIIVVWLYIIHKCGEMMLSLLLPSYYIYA